jgi:hypothetical protein
MASLAELERIRGLISLIPPHRGGGADNVAKIKFHFRKVRFQRNGSALYSSELVHLHAAATFRIELSLFRQ